MNKEYKSLVFTNHGLDRLESRSITQDMVWRAISNQNKKYHEKGKTKFIATINGRRIHVVAEKLQKEGKWLVISAWVRGEDDQAPLAWRIISFPFWLMWQILKLVLQLFMPNNKK